MDFQEGLKKFKAKADIIITKNNVIDIIFSDNIYEVEVFDENSKKTFWPFLQIDDEKNILDAFCTCSTAEKLGFCEHLTAGYLKISKNEKPLHLRFKNSFFNAVFKVISKQIGYDPSKLKKIQPGIYLFKSNTKKQLFYIECKKKSQRRLEEYLKVKIFPIEENSLKFSTRSLDEIEALKRGRASDQLKYELSYLCDIAKWFFLKYEEDQKNCKIEFKEKKDGLFSIIDIIFNDIFASFYIPYAHLNEIIPTLNSVNSPLKLFEYEGKKIKAIFYDKEKKCFNIETEKELLKEDKKEVSGIDVDNYLYVEDIGFYPKKIDELLSKEKILENEINYFLKKYQNVFLNNLKNEKISAEKVLCKYYLYFDENENLHINGYLFEKDDFLKKHSVVFKDWAFIDDRGFYQIDNLYFDDFNKIIPKDQVSEFVTKHRVWLHSIEGFQTHFGSLQSHLIYELLDDDRLIFQSKLDFPQEFDFIIDFEDWVYIKGIGFYSKKEKRTSLPIRPGLELKKEEISRFIDQHIDELELIDNFFTSKKPIEKMGLKVFLNEENKIVVKPEIVLNKGFQIEDLKFFDSYVYLKNEGFFKIPKSFLLPERAEEEKVISLSNENFFITYELERLKPYITYLDPALKKPKDLSLKLTKLIKKRRNNKTFYLVDLFYISEYGSINAGFLLKSILENKRYVFTSAGLIFLKKPRFNWLKNLKKTALFKENLLKLNTLDFIKLFLLEDVKIYSGLSKDAKEIEKILEELKSFESEKYLDISLLKANLRPYQELGVKWLWFLYTNSLSGLLCDDMGLGKTHQSMALIAASKIHDNYKYLVVCPTSVIYHWEELLKTFLPSLKPYVYHGTFRKLENFSKDYDLLLTSYGIIRQEKDLFKKFKFEIAIFDEIQIAKNANSLTHKALKKINTNMRLGLTGTPIENYLKELKAIYDIVLPTYLPSDNAFKEFFINPIEKLHDQQRKNLLKKIISPFILRRKKKDVLYDLPDKIEEIAYCDLSDEQKNIYNEILSSSKEKILQDLKDQSKSVPFIHIFSLLSKLKQACDHPSLILKDIKSYSKHTSGKFELFKELLNEAINSEQKVVVFSQYLDMIAIIEDYLRKKSIGFASIKGATKKRFEQIKKFKEDPKCMVFVASLLAAGVGIDLTAGSIVIHYDRWWNPAKENQATDRVHRIGQNRGVQVFKMVSKNTIEERIHAIIESKQYLIEETIGKDEVDQVKTLSREELLEILKNIEI
ncbi:MAG: DEAD/DEAH box helicase [Parachlamydiales bacterium]|nr:DEAD/DEAH box helicase [Parachlamydiales bacterium]